MTKCNHKWEHQTRSWCLSFWMCTECEMELSDEQYDAVKQSYTLGQLDMKHIAAQAADNCHGEASTCGDVIAALAPDEVQHG